MRVRVGTSGFSYAEWRGSFYPKSLKPVDMLRFYAERLSTVEINNTFYRMPKADVVAGWYEQAPEDFSFVLKASQRITHQQRLKDSAESVAYLFRVAAILRDKLGPILFQLPPFLRKDLPLLDEFLAALPEGCRAAFEFRHPTWFDDAVYASLSRHGASLCLADVDEDNRSTPLVGTTGWGYLRLRRESYTDAELDAWAARIAEQSWDYAHVFFKHEVLGPIFAASLAARCDSGRAQPQLPLADLIRAAEQAAARGAGAEATSAAGTAAASDGTPSGSSALARKPTAAKRSRRSVKADSGTPTPTPTPEPGAEGKKAKPRRPAARKLLASD